MTLQEQELTKLRQVRSLKLIIVDIPMERVWLATANECLILEKLF